MKKALVFILALMLLGLMTGVALAADPSTDGNNITYTEKGNIPEGDEYNAQTPVTEDGKAAGASRWFYRDKMDVDGDGNPVYKYEGSYNAFHDQDNQLYDYEEGRDSGPHGGYNTTSNKCKTCHAVHRATGTFALMRVDTPDQACEYCHIGDHRHSVVNAFWQAGTIYPKNGHTMGAGDEIPDSSVWQWEELTEITGGDDATFEVRARRYNASKNKLMRWTMHGGRWLRVGPTLLRCQSCHQPHNAIQQVWKPYKSIDNGATRWDTGYKLLRLSPSGGIASGFAGKDASGTVVNSSTYRLNPGLGYFDNTSGDPRLKVVERATIDVRPTTVPVNDEGTGAATFAGGVNRTGYTAYRYHGDGKKPGDTAYDDWYGNVPVYETSMSFFCADCHNLNIAGKDLVASQLGIGKFGNSMLGDRSHAVPMEITGDGRGTGAGASSGFHCYACHNSDMPLISKHASVDPTYTLAASGNTGEGSVTLSKTCNNCHVSPVNYQKLKQTYRTFMGVNGGPSLSDWPHSGPDTGYKLLNAVAPLDKDVNGDTVAGAWDASGPGEVSGAEVRTPYTGGANELDKICLICHGPEQSRSIGYDK